MNTKSPFYAILFLLIITCQEAHAMKGFGHKASHGFRLGMQALSIAAVAGCYAYEHKLGASLFSDYLANNPHEHKLGAESKEYILSTMRDAYPELKDRDIKVVHAPFTSWAAVLHNNQDYLVAPCSDKDLISALTYNRLNTSRYTPEKLELIGQDYGMSIPEYIAMCEAEGTAMTAQTLPLWTGSLLHEASHIAHNDCRNRNRLCNTLPLFVIAGSSILKRATGLGNLLQKPTLTNNILKGLGYIPSTPLKIACCMILRWPFDNWREYAADQNAIEKTQDPRVLKAMSNFFEQMHYVNERAEKTQDLTLFAKLMMLRNPHPAFKTRAKYFADAAQKLEEKQAHEMNKVEISHD
ncbi:MAG: M48 family metalloprotease [Candidatus Babeliales bacterium]